MPKALPPWRSRVVVSLSEMFGLSLSDLIQKAFEHLASFRPRLSL
jgi:hypothetical protein